VIRPRPPLAVALVAGVVAAGCCDDHVLAVSTSLDPNLSIGFYYTWVGDMASLYAAALSDPSRSAIFCSVEVYTSTNQPGRFQYSTTDPTVGIVDERGRFIAQGVGRTGVITSTAGVTDTTFIIVGPAFASLRIVATPLPAHVGDTITLQLDALDEAGAVVTGAEVSLLETERQSDSLAGWIRSIRAPRPFPSVTFQSPLVDRLVLRRAGVVRIVAVAPHDTNRPIQYPTDTLLLTITAP
jgi:hypothetical protein